MRRLDKAGPSLGGEEVAVMDRHLRQGGKGAQIGVLPLWCLGIKPAGNAGCIVVDALYVAARQHGRAERGNIEPFVRCFSQRPVIEIKPVYVDDRF